MAYDVKLPDIGEIVRWLVKAGETVREDQPLVEVMTDKASVEIPSPRAGTIAALHAEQGAVVPVGTVIVSIATADEPVGVAAAGPAKAAATAPAATPAMPARPGGAGGVVEATPAVRALARDLGVALESVKGSGPGG